MFSFSLYGRGNVTNGEVNFGTCTLTVTGGTVNEPPVADADGPYVGDVGEPVSLDGSGSFDPDLAPDQIVSYAWDLDNDGQFDDAAGRSRAFLGPCSQDSRKACRCRFACR